MLKEGIKEFGLPMQMRLKKLEKLGLSLGKGLQTIYACNASDCPSNMWGHREDWYFANYDGKAQMTRMRNRECGFKEALTRRYYH